MDTRYRAATNRQQREFMQEVAREEFGSTIPMRKEVCPSCHGNGSYVNPNIDSHGIGVDEFYEDPDFEESYLAGHYDMTCEECEGTNVIDVVNKDFATPEMVKFVADWYTDYYESLAEQEAEMRMGY